MEESSFFDAILLAPYPRGNSRNEKYQFYKYYGADVFEFLFWLEKMRGESLNTLREIEVYFVRNRRGKTQVQFMNKRKYRGVELSVLIATYKRIHKSKFIKKITG